MTKNVLLELGMMLDERQSRLDGLDAYYNGKQPMAYLSPESKSAVAGRLRTLNVGFCKLAVNSLAERLRVIGFRRNGQGGGVDPELWSLWRQSGMFHTAQQAILDALVYGSSYISVWVDEFGQPVAAVESPKQMVVRRHPVTHEVTDALKVVSHTEPNGVVGSVAYVYSPTEIQLWKAASFDAPVQSGAFVHTDTVANPLGVVPIVPLTNQGRVLDFEGVSEMDDLLDLVDALNKVMADAMVTSEAYARPRRWATGVEIDEDADGKPIDPFAKETMRTWISEEPGSKFGQFQQADLSSYTGMVAMLTQQIGAVAGLPPHYLGLNGDQPPSADSIRSSESSLVAKAAARQGNFSQPLARVVALLHALETGQNFDPRGIETLWANPETRTPTQQVDAAQKLVEMGVPLNVALVDQMGYLPEQMETITGGNN